MNPRTQRQTPVRALYLPLERKLAAYALATGAILAGSEQAKADIIYSGVVDQSIGRNSSFNLDVNGDSIIDFTIANSISGDGSNLAITAPGNNAVMLAGNFAAGLNPFDPIPGNAQLGGARRVMGSFRVFCTSKGCSTRFYGPWLGARNKFLGLRFEIPDDGTHYGWARLSVYGDLTATLHDWAYETEAGKQILAGDTIGGGQGAANPEPSSLALLALGALGVLALARFRKSA